MTNPEDSMRDVGTWSTSWKVISGGPGAGCKIRPTAAIREKLKELIAEEWADVDRRSLSNPEKVI